MSKAGYPSRFARGWASGYNERKATSPLAMISTTPKFNVRTNRQKDPWEFTGDRAPQAEVTVNLLVNPDLIKARQQNSKIARTKGMSTMGTLMKTDDIQIREKDLVFVPKIRRSKNGTLYGSVKDPHAISSFTGALTTSEIFGSHDQFEASFYLVGKSKIPYVFGSPEQSKSGISVMTSGATTVHNNGVETFAFGDLVAWYTYNIDDEVREQQVMSVRKARGEPPEKFGALLRRATYRDIHKLTQNALERYIVASNKGRRDEFLTSHYRDNLPNKREFDALRRHFRAGCVQSTAVDTLLTIMTFEQLGLITVNLPASPTQAGFERIEAGFKDVDLDSLKRTGGYGVAGGTFDVNAVPNGDTKKDEVWNHGLGLAHLLNVIPDPNQKISPLTSVLDILIKRKFRGLMEGNESHKHRAISSILLAGPVDLINVSSGMPAAGSMAQLLDLIQMNSARDTDAAFYNAFRRAVEQIFAISLSSTSEPGKDLDVVM